MVTPADIAAALGRPTPAPDSAEHAQWSMWINDALLLIQARVESIVPEPTLNPDRVDYVVREAVVAQVRRPDDATQVTISSDDTASSRTYRSGSGRVTILDEWWVLLGLAGGSGSAYTIDTAPTPWRGVHADICDLRLGGLTCSCGSNINRYEGPLYEGGLIS